MAVLPRLFDRDGLRITGIWFEEPRLLRLIASGVSLDTEAALPPVLAAAESALGAAPSADRVELTLAVDAPGVADRIQIDLGEIAELRVLDNATGWCLRRITRGRARLPSTQTWEEVQRDPTSIVFFPGALSLPDGPRFSPGALAEPLKQIVAAAEEIYRRWIDSLAILGEVMVLIFQANVPEGAATLRARLDRLAAEELHPEVLKQSLNILGG